jgi:probable rRNA maturation factor
VIPRAAPRVHGADEQTVVPVELMRWVRLAEHVLDGERAPDDAEMAIVFVDATTIADLNQQYLGGDGPTDVLAFPMDELRPGLVNEEPEEGILGDLMLCPTVAERQAVTAGHSTDAELELLTVHGILHLLGYDHAEPEEHAEMFGLQDELLAAWRGRHGSLTGR